ncbi:MAG: HNH endonuclease [Proteobacteria bacterium]|nr:HNH endonuclease [Pseudomonadota bacterium]
MKCRHDNSTYKNGGQYKTWARLVKERDNFTCQLCGKSGCWLESDHVKSWAVYPELRFDLANGRTLCRDCHQKTDNYAGRVFFN